ncbi:MAG: triphosphoribosyl-dephospho-CoA synthase [Planctomycetales bacterium]|nr:triphosphoribosyl-dephospho-CoA synthase [Planctomycetales bacterium]
MTNFSIGQLATLACTLEVTAPKPGNVHRAADFEDCTLNEFLVSAIAIGPIMDSAPSGPLGEVVLRAVNATRNVARSNTNLGIALLLAPLSCATTLPIAVSELRENVARVLAGLTPDDARKVYEAIGSAQAGGLQVESASEMNVDAAAPDNLLDAMRFAASYDMIARQYANDFQDVFDFVVPHLNDPDNGEDLTDRIIRTHLHLMAEFPDSLIQRKLGESVARESSMRASRVLNAGSASENFDNYEAALADFDFWLRSDGNRRNPGTSADLIAAGLFVGLLTDLIKPPFC